MGNIKKKEKKIKHHNQCIWIEYLDFENMTVFLGMTFLAKVGMDEGHQ